MNTLSGYAELELGGQTVPFKFGTNAWALFCERRGIEFNDIARTNLFGKWEDNKMVTPPDVLVLRDLYYCGHLAALRSKGEQVKLSIEQFTDLLDETEDAIIKLQQVMVNARFMGFNIGTLAAEGKTENFQ